MSWNASTRIPTSSVRIVVAGLEALGHTVPDLADSTIPVAAAADLLEHAVAVGGSDFGVRAGRTIPHGALGLVDHLCAAASTGRAMLEDLERYFTLVASGVRLHVDGADLVLGLRDAIPLRHRQLLAELVFSLLDARMAERGAGRAFAVGFPWAASEAARSHWQHATVDAADCRMTFTTATLDSPLRTTDDSLRHLLESYARRELEQQPSAETTTQRARAVLREALPGGPPSAAQVARAFGMSDRTLRRALHAEGATFSEVRDDALREVAEHALRDPDRSIGEVAWLLGYSEPSAFHRAFRRWTGATPEAFRQAGRLGP